MEEKHKVEIKTNGGLTHIFIDGKEEEMITEYKLEQDVQHAPLLTIKKIATNTDITINECYVKEITQ